MNPLGTGMQDRMAVLGDPTEPGLFYVAGNAGALAWRVNATTGVWTQLWDSPDVTDGSLPHGDCRNYACVDTLCPHFTSFLLLPSFSPSIVCEEPCLGLF